MKYMSLLILLFCLLMGCKQTVQNPPKPSEDSTEVIVVPSEPTETPTEDSDHQSSDPIGPEYPVGGVKKVFTVKIEDTNYNTAQKEKLKKAAAIIEKIFNSEEYKQEVINWGKFTNNKGLSNLAIYEKLFAGAEALMPAINYQMDLTVTMYYAGNSTVGYTYPSKMKVWTNSKFHNKYTPLQVASNLVHEWTHKMGFDHTNAKDSKSVPYSHNAIIKKLGVKYE